MNRLGKPLIIMVLIFIVMIFAFKIHVLLGIILILFLVGYILYTSRSNFYAVRGSAYFAKDDLETALVYYKKAYECKSCPEKHQVGYAYLLLRSGDLELAERILQELLKSSNNRENLVQIQCNLATLYWLLGKKEQGLASLEKVFVEYKNTLVYGNLGYFKILNGDLDDALKFNLEAYSYNSDDRTIIDNLALNYYLLGQTDQAEEMFQKLMTKPPKYAEPYYYYALTLKRQGKAEEALEQMKAALMKKLSFISPITYEHIKKEVAQFESF
jgi:tetratricopeptide (TPR) repeat protein